MRRRRDPERMAQKTEVAETNRAAREARTPEQQIAVLDDRLGVEMGAKKERTRLINEIEQRLNQKRNSKEAQKPQSKKPKSRSDRRKEKAKRHAEKQMDSK